MSLEDLIKLSAEKGYDIHFTVNVSFANGYEAWLFPSAFDEGGYPHHQISRCNSLEELECAVNHILVRVPHGGRFPPKK